MATLTNTELVELMKRHNIYVVDLAWYSGMSKNYISSVRTGKYPISDKFKLCLIDYLVKKKGVDLQVAIMETRLGGFYND